MTGSVNADGSASPSRAVVVHPSLRGQETLRQPLGRLAEACGLAEAISLAVVAAEEVPVATPKPATR